MQRLWLERDRDPLGTGDPRSLEQISNGFYQTCRGVPRGHPGFCLIQSFQHLFGRSNQISILAIIIARGCFQSS
jgi:hypothetical protein